jgi:capsular polysaccharide transport system permease protein
MAVSEWTERRGMARRAVDEARARIRVIMALVIREMSVRFGSKFGGYAWAIAEPAAYIVLLSAIFSAIGRAPPLGQSFLLFYASGFIAMQFYTSLVGHINNAIKGNKNLLNYPIVAPIDFIIARFILQTVTMTLIGHLVIGFALIYSGTDISLRYQAMIPAALTGSLIAVGIGLFNIVAFQMSTLYEQIFNIITRPMFIISGVIFLPESLPQPYRDWIMLNPVAHVILWFRTGIYPYYRAPDLDIGYLLICTAVIFLIGLTVFSLSKKVRESS